MVRPNSDNQETILEEAVSRFVHAQSQGEQPDVDEFVKQYPEIEPRLRQRIQSLKKIDTLFDSLVQADEDDFEDEVTAIRNDLVGRKLGGFEIVEVIGRGGMGVVYLAHDTRLKRSVAVKSIPAALADDSTARMRFKREAELLASLNHPNIAVIHDIIEQKDDTGYLVLEYVPGQTLAQRIAHKPLRLQEALLISRQIAGAVSAAHDNGVIHRDLKPGNIKITPDDRVKVLDFGLAKTAGGDAAINDNTVTQPGSIVGTPTYMSPEQIRGDSVDRHTDIWSFGCILYEMLTGKRPFEGKTASDTVSRTLEREPDWEVLPQKTPVNIKVLLRRCLEKDPHRRLQHIGDAVVEISETLDLPEVAPPIIEIVPHIPQSRRNKRLKVIGTICLFLLGACTGVAVLRYISPGPEVIRPIHRYTIRPPGGIRPGALWKRGMTLSPDGRKLVYMGHNQEGTGALCLRDMDDVSSKLLRGTEGAYCPFFSDDGQWIGFYDETGRGELKKISVAGGAATSLCKPEEKLLSGCWGPDNTIIFDTDSGELWCFTASEGMRKLTIPDPNQHGGPSGHMCPQFLPDGEQVLFTNRLSKDSSRMELLSLRTGRRKTLFQEDGTDARYVPTGHLVFARDDTLFAVPFDIDKLEVKGPARPVVEGIHVSLMGPAQYTFSENGTLAYVSALPRKRRLVWVDRQGVVQPLGAPSRAYQSVRVSPDPDGARLAVTIAPKLADDADVWILDKARLTLHQLTLSGDNRAGIWTPDGKRVIYTHISGWKWSQSLVVPMSILADGSGEPETLAEGEKFAEKPGLRFWGSRCLSPDGKYLLGGTDNIWVLPMEPNASPRPFIMRDNSRQRHPAFSPDGKWVAYDSEETGRGEIYVCPFPGPGRITPISSEGGYEPTWSRDGKELFYRWGAMMAVTVEVVTTETGPELRAGTPQELFKGQFFYSGVESVAGFSYDVDADGRFIMIQEDEESEIVVVLNWFEELKRLVPIEKKE